MRTGGTFAGQLRVQHQRQPRERMPVAGVNRAESPDDAVQRQTGADANIGRKIIRVVVIDKVEARDRPENRERCRSQQQANENRTGKHA